ncbi:Wzz/FepE/Etk N-terminal domain-containing protein [Aeromonas veronii]|uniref:Wzz/FepE/Etk N-terminal domain-containing protein n=1 Tax=Aeromonas veronii TaxID=654 RepID=UPI00307EDFE6
MKKRLLLLTSGHRHRYQMMIDLRELVLVLWRQKVLILSVTLLFAIAGIGYTS